MPGSSLPIILQIHLITSPTHICKCVLSVPNVSSVASFCIIPHFLSVVRWRACRIGVGFLGFFANFAKKWQIAYSISHLFLRMRYSVMSLKDPSDPEGFLALFARNSKNCPNIHSTFNFLTREKLITNTANSCDLLPASTRRFF
jgi:hypothetical protein